MQKKNNISETNRILIVDVRLLRIGAVYWWNRNVQFKMFFFHLSKVFSKECKNKHMSGSFQFDMRRFGWHPPFLWPRFDGYVSTKNKIKKLTIKYRRYLAHTIRNHMRSDDQQMP